MELYVVRHAAAEEPDEARWPDDERPLTEKGASEFVSLVAKLDELPDRFDLIASSPLLRARQTADLLFEETGARRRDQWYEMRPEAEPRETIKRILKEGPEQLAIVGHQPHIGRLLSLLTTGIDAEGRFRKGAIALVEFEPSQEPAGRVRWTFAP